MKVTKTKMAGLMTVEPSVFADTRGYFMETYQRLRYKEAGIDVHFIQDNLAFSRKNILRGLHYQSPHDQAKLVQVFQGEVFDVAVDIRRGSPTFGQWFGTKLSAENKVQLFVPAGFAHGYCVLSETALFHYKCSDYYAPKCEGGVLWSDPDVGITWPLDKPILSDKDAASPRLKDVPLDRLPEYTDG
jgi:dTDP-4-dehydrorhamnose 3,5-epimerase